MSSIARFVSAWPSLRSAARRCAPTTAPSLIAASLLIGSYPCASAFAQGEREADVEIAVEQFGVGGVFRAGDFVAVRLQLTSNLPDAATDVQVVWEMPEAQGDIAQLEREITLTRGQPLSVWMYAKLLPTADVSDVWPVRIYRDEDGRRGSELDSAPLTPMNTMAGSAQSAHITSGLIAIVGGARMLSLDDYNTINPHTQEILTGHEATAIVSGLSPRDLPDRWEGLDSFEAVVWTEASPRELRELSARALREYVQRGGHLVIVLPAAGSEWGLGAGGLGPLDDLLPQTAPRTDSATLSELLPILSKREVIDPRDEFTMPIHVFETVDNYYDPLVALPKPDSRIVAVQRFFGHGRITVVGIDLNSGQLIASARSGRGDYLEADVIWNRILGRRVDSLNNAQATLLYNERKLDLSRRHHVDGGKGQFILDEITLAGQAAAGIGLAFMLFVLYWACAGPVSFALLKKTKRTKHAWVAFAATSALFTGVAWGSVKLFSQKNVVVDHLSVIDFVDQSSPAVDDSQPAFARATSWFTVFLPGYGELKLSLDTEPTVRNLLTAFSAPGVPISRFRNVDRYELSLRSPEEYEVPVRATTREMYARWMGPLDEEWGYGFLVEEPLRVMPGGLLAGKIVHRLPGDLTNVQIILIEPSRNQAKRYPDKEGDDAFLGPSNSGVMLNRGSWWELGTQRRESIWRSGQQWDLANVTSGAGAAPLVNRLRDLAENASRDRQRVGGSLSSNERIEFLTLLSVFHQAPPPTYSKRESEFRLNDESYTFDRWVGREIDLSPWFNRPCVIIIGELRNSEIPVPFKVRDRRPTSNGLTIVRWIYPLPVTLDDVAPNPPETIE